MNDHAREKPVSHCLENEDLRVTFFATPFHVEYLHRKSGRTIEGGSAAGYLRLNGVDAKWESWKHESSQQDEAIVFMRKASRFPTSHPVPCSTWSPPPG